MSKFKVGDKATLKPEFRGIKGYGRVGTVNSFHGGDLDYPYLRYEDGYEDWHYEDALELITNQGGAQMARKTYKSIKELPELKKGAFLQEKCDDGDQDFAVLDPSYIKYEDEHGRKSATYPRKAIEEEANFFVEVFQVEPQFMTAPELEQWEAFKATQTKKSVAKVVDTRKTSAWTPARRKAQSVKIKAAWAAKKAA